MSNLMLKSVAGLAFLLGALGLALFLSAGTLGYWQAWLYLAVFGGCTLLITLDLMRSDQRLLASRVQVGPVAETQKSQQVIQSLASLAFISLYIVAGLDRRFGWSSVPAVVSLLAEAVVALGFWIVFRVFKENTYTSATIEVAEEQRVITTGPYRVVRHPMYSGAGLMLLASAPALGSWAALPLAVVVIFVIVARLLDEEAFLVTSLPGYDTYRRQVRYRLIPFVW